jgi:hypothetical protein
MVYDVIVTVRFFGVEAENEEAAKELVNEAMGCNDFYFNHPTNRYEVEPEYQIEELAF